MTKKKLNRKVNKYLINRVDEFRIYLRLIITFQSQNLDIS